MEIQLPILDFLFIQSSMDGSHGESTLLTAPTGGAPHQRHSGNSTYSSMAVYDDILQRNMTTQICIRKVSSQIFLTVNKLIFFLIMTKNGVLTLFWNAEPEYTIHFAPAHQKTRSKYAKINVLALFPAHVHGLWVPLMHHDREF